MNKKIEESSWILKTLKSSKIFEYLNLVIILFIFTLFRFVELRL